MSDRPSQNLATFFQDLIDDAADTFDRISREGERLRELKARASFGFRVLGHVAKSELEETVSRVAMRIAELGQQGKR